MDRRRPRLGVLGGSFDPPHIGHLALASEACGALGLERVLFVPAAAPPHKEAAGRTSASTRLSLAEVAVEEDIRFVTSTIELEHALVYTSDMMTALSLRHPDHDLVFVMGSDSLLQLETWHEPERLLDVCSLAVGLRPGDAPPAVAAAAERWGEARVTILDAPPMAVSSTDIRARVAAGRPIRYLVANSVEERIFELGLYR